MSGYEVVDLGGMVVTETTPVVAGPPGKSAYEVAVAEGFTGTRSEWLDSLVGADGGGAVDSVNGQAGAVDLDAADVDAEPAGAVADHAAATTGVHGIVDTALLETQAGAQAKVDAASTAARARENHTGVQTAGTISDFTEAVQDAVAALLASGTQVTLSYNDVGDTLTVSATGADAETMRDTIGAALVGVGLVAVTVNDVGDTITISTTATANSTDAQLRDRSTHTGSQAISTITGLQAALDAKPNAPLFAIRTSDAVINNSVTLTNDTQLVVTLEANSTYEFQALLNFTSTSAADAAISFTVPAGAAGFWFSDGAGTSVGSSGNTAVGRKAMTYGAADPVGTSTGSPTAAGPRGVVKTGVTAGSLRLQWAQNVLTAADTTLLTNSYLVARKLA